MKRLQWKSIADADLEGTVWDGIGDARAQLDTALLTELFRRKPRKPHLSKEDKDGKAKPKKKKDEKLKPMIADGPLRTLQGSVMRLKAGSAEEVVRHVYEMDVEGPDAMMTPDYATRVKAFVPDAVKGEKERAMIEEREGMLDLVVPVERYMIILNHVPNLSERMQSVIVRSEFPDWATSLTYQVEALENATKAAASSYHLKTVLRFLLAIGNYMNGGTKLGRASGIKIGLLAKMTETKALDMKTTLADFLVSTLKLRTPEALAVTEDLACIKDALRVKPSNIRVVFKRLKRDVSVVSEQLARCQQHAKSRGAGSEEELPFIRVMEPFAEIAGQVIGKLDIKIKSALKAFDEMVKCFGENFSRMNARGPDSNAFFEVLSTFVTDMTAAKAKAERMERAAGK